ncbi:MAG: nickel pincer cofactor biosynthesis protein LarC [Firmicutes bacterium]|nr:nickel pincer cofactor biosynthesis protein LarC [Bacillota bacterium]
MRGLYLECTAGAAGDMILAALHDCGLEMKEFKKQLQLLPVKGYVFASERTNKKSLSALQIKIHVTEKQPARNLPEITAIIKGAALSTAVKEKSIAVFQTLARAEAKIHGISADKVHFHEVGAVDAIVDIVGSVIALEMLGVEQIFSSPLPLGKGWIKASHGWIPLPAPAAAEIIRERGIPCYGISLEEETVTPTGAALLGTLSSGFIPLPPMIIEKIGYGAGTKDFDRPNVVRAFVGKLTAAGQFPAGENLLPGKLLTEPLEIIEANVDDLNPEIYDYVLKKLLSAGALDVYFTPIQMKKNRPAVKITILASPQKSYQLGRILLQETTTLGFRRHSAEKIMLPREQSVVETPWGPVRVVVAGQPPDYHNIAPEYDDCSQIAGKHNVPLKKVYQHVWKTLKP